MKIVLEASAACELVLGRARASDVAEFIRSANEVLVPELYVVLTVN